jgi:hypothetical protein
MASSGVVPDLPGAYNDIWDLDGEDTPPFERIPYFGKTTNDLVSFTISEIPYLTLNCVYRFCATYNIYAIMTFDASYKLDNITFSCRRPPPHVNFADATPLATTIMEKLEPSAHHDGDRVRATTLAIITSILAHITPAAGTGTIELFAKHYTATLIVKVDKITSDQIKSILNIDGVTRITCSEMFYAGISVEFNVRDPPTSSDCILPAQKIPRRGSVPTKAKAAPARRAIRKGNLHPKKFKAASRIQTKTDVFSSSITVPSSKQGAAPGRRPREDEEGEEEEEEEDVYGTEEEEEEGEELDG